MYANNLQQLINFAYFILTGVILSVVFDVFRILRRTFKTSDIITNIEDILFGIITSIIIISSIFIFNNGQLRLYIFLGIIFGITLYMLFISKYFININVLIINTLKKTINIIFQPFSYIFKFAKKILFKPISFIIINIKGVIGGLILKFKKKE